MARALNVLRLTFIASAETNFVKLCILKVIVMISSREDGD